MVNPGTITDTLSWYKIPTLSGYSVTCVKHKLRRRWRRVYESSWSRHKNRKLFIRTSHWNLANLFDELSWNRRTSTPHRSETKGIAERAVRRVKEGTSPVLLQSGLDEKWWSDSMECLCYLRNVQDSFDRRENFVYRWMPATIKSTSTSRRMVARTISSVDEVRVHLGECSEKEFKCGNNYVLHELYIEDDFFEVCHGRHVRLRGASKMEGWHLHQRP